MSILLPGFRSIFLGERHIGHVSVWPRGPVHVVYRSRLLFPRDHLLVKPNVLDSASSSPLMRYEEIFAPTPYGRRAVVRFDSFISLRAASRVN